MNTPNEPAPLNARQWNHLRAWRMCQPDATTATPETLAARYRDHCTRENHRPTAWAPPPGWRNVDTDHFAELQRLFGRRPVTTAGQETGTHPPQAQTP